VIFYRKTLKAMTGVAFTLHTPAALNNVKYILISDKVKGGTPCKTLHIILKPMTGVGYKLHTYCAIMRIFINQ
jgi:hypothetical protein